MTTHTMSDWTDIGEQLRKAREERDLELRDVSHSTRIPLATLTALEDSDYSIFPSPAYARSFLSQYSEFLNVDAHDWVEAFETGDVLSNVNDHGYLQTHNEHIGEQQAAREAPQRPSRSNNAPPEKTTSSGTGTSILQTLSVFLMTALLLGGGIYAYKKFEPQLMGAIKEDEKSTDDETVSSPEETPAPANVPPTSSTPPKAAQVPPATTPTVPPLVVQTDPSKQPDGTTRVTPPEVKPTPPKRRTGPPPKAMVVEEDE